MKYFLDKYFEKTKGFYPFFKYCPQKYQAHYINRRAAETLGYDYNYLEPKTFNEKIRWLIYNERLKSKSLLTDKIKVKTYITAKIGEGHCAPIFGIWNNFDDIDFSYIPNEFVLKTNHAWNTNLFVQNKKHIFDNKASIKKLVSSWLRMQYEQYSLEPQYKDIEPKLFIECLLHLQNKKRCDYQVHCFNGRPVMVEIPIDITASCFYDCDWKILPYTIKYVSYLKKVEKPEFLEEMLKFAEILSAGFSYVRIDFTNSNNNLHVLEMTFTPCGAMIPFNDNNFDKELGKLLKLPLAVAA